MQVRSYRLEPNEITRFLSITEAARPKIKGICFKIVLAIFCLILCYLIVESLVFLLPFPLRLILFVPLFAPTLCVIFCPLNHEALKWFFSELASGRGNPSYDKRLRLEDEVQSAKVSSIGLKDFVRLADHPETSETQGSEQSRSVPSSVLLNYYHLVIAKLPCPDSGRIELCVLGQDRPYDLEIGSDADRFLRRKPKSPPPLASKNRQAAEVANAFADLMSLLDEDQYEEESLAQQLNVECGHDLSSIRVAIRVAKSGRLIACKRTPRYALEILNIYKRRATVIGHAGCKLYLTPSGVTWKNADPRRQVGFDLLTSGGIMHQYNTNSNVTNQTTVGDGNKVGNTTTNPTWSNNQISDVEALARELSELLNELQKRVDDPEQYRALAEVMSAMKDAQRGDGAEAESKLARLGSLAENIRKWVFDTAAAIRAPIIVELLKKYLHLP